ncbi:polysaccharide deacetylase family protein [Adhaeribacter sp. BT258]|uniref:Polysaccharide deacetylase family protein n=1 Tax=Adhaeribacter terrigena TaxID=2793070 RepID=A0ABS1BX97_9BACT|nr:polysaccharide deacetylase family protein [Adhaeribacter terrigena]MBK0401526.1 polysaccharide deacetylase family protein [Adhaeribacter terrigena]
MHNALILHYQPAAASGSPNLSVQKEDLAAQLALIKKLRMPVVSLEELVENDRKRKRWHRHALLISCTDTFLAQNPTVFQQLKASGFPVTVFASTTENPDPERINFWQELVGAGFSLGSQGISPVDLTQLPEEKMRIALTESKRILEEITGKEVRHFLPIGDLNKKVMAAAQEAGYEALLSGKIGYNSFNADLMRLKTWKVPAQVSLKAFEHMLLRDRKELLTQELKAQALKNGRRIIEKSLFGKLKGLFRKVRV